MGTQSRGSGHEPDSRAPEGREMCKLPGNIVVFCRWRVTMEYGELYASRAQVLLSTLGLFSLLLCAPPITLGAPAAGFPLRSSQASPLTGAVTISAPDVTVEPGLIGVQFRPTATTSTRLIRRRPSRSCGTPPVSPP